MQITILAAGSRGDVQPFLALGTGLQAAGHRVRLAAFRDFASFVTAHGLEFFPVDADFRAIMGGEDGQDFIQSGHNLLQFMRHLRQIVGPIMMQLGSDFWQACQDTHAIISGLNGLPYFGFEMAEKLGVPYCSASILPFVRTREFPIAGWPLSWHLGGTYNSLTYRIMEQAGWQIFRAAINCWRREALNLPPAPFWGAYRYMQQQRYPMLIGISPHVIPRPQDWPAWFEMAGYWFLPRPLDWQPPDDLVRFLQAGSPPICISFGSMRDRGSAEMTRIVLGALEKTDQRGILVTAWGGLRSIARSEQVFVTDSVPFDWLWPQCAAVVHHGGAGTTSAGLRAGVPSIIVPFFADQPFWGRRVFELGCGPRPIPRKRISVDRLAEAIAVAVADQAMPARAIQLGRQIQAEDGIMHAVEFFEKRVSRQA